jgi:predicted SAM-dependent methyltransferase
MRLPTKAGLRRRRRAATTSVLRKAGRSRTRAILRRAALPEGAKVHLGCGPVHLDRWVNVDIARDVKPDIRVDLRFGFPAFPSSVAFIFSEHVFEHLSLENGVQLFADCQRALLPGGVMRIAMPDLRYIVDRYLGDWKNQTWLQDPGYLMIDTPARMLNFALRSWEHLYVYDIADLTLRLNEAGFTEVAAQEWGQSEHPELRGLERRPDSMLIVEATK